MQFEDLTVYCDKGKKWKNIHNLAPKFPFRLIVAGSSGCGKTNMVVNLLKYIYIDKLYLYAKCLDEPLYELIGDLVEHKSNRIEDMRPIDDFDKNLQNVVIIDDMINEDHTGINEMFIRGRKQGISVIYITQSYYRTPKTIRLNSNYCCIFGCNSAREIRLLCDDNSSQMEYKDFKKIFTAATSGKHNFLTIDNRTNEPHLKLRQGWDRVLSG